jgi:lysophospholipase L1-like esterase
VSVTTPPDPDPTPKALSALASVLGSLVLAALLSYAVPSLARVRPWVPGEGVPIVRMFGPRAGQGMPSFAEAGGAPAAAGGKDERLEQALAASRQAGPSATSSAAGADGSRLRIEAAEYDGVVQTIEGAEHLGTFFAALEHSALRKPGAVTRIAHYGDSAVAADAIASTARRALQQRFGDSGHGFVLVSAGDMHYIHKDVMLRSSDGWEIHSLVRASLGEDWYGYGGIQYRGGSGQYALFGTRDDSVVGRAVSSFEVFFQSHRGGCKLQLKVDDSVAESIDTRAEAQADGFHKVEVPDGPHTLSLRTAGAGQCRVYGVALERSQPGVVYDSLGLVGARAQRLLNARRDHMARQVAHRDPSLLVLGFGGNEAGNKWLDIAKYSQELVQVVRHMRAGDPEMSCLLFGPLDQGEKDARGNLVTIEKLPEIVAVQRKVAAAEGCGFFDAYAAMGGANSVRAWYQHRPRLMSSDFRHATPEGYDVIGTLYYKALLQAFAKHLAH